MILFKKQYYLTTAATCLCMLSSIPNVNAETFRDALTAALQYHPSVEAAQASKAGADDQIVEQKSALYPELNVNATAGRVFGDNATSRGLSVTRGEGYSWLWEGSVGINQTLYDGFETKERINAASSRARAAQIDIVDLRENIALQTAGAYFDVMRTKEALNMITAHNAQILDYKDRIVMMVDEGAADEAELRQSEDITILLDNILAEYKAQYQNAITSYEQLTGEPPKGAMMIPEWDRSLMPANLEGAHASVLNHPALESIEYQIQASYHDVGAEKANFYPEISSELSYLKKDVDDVIGGEVQDAKAVLRMNWNFSLGGAQYAKVRQRQASLFETQAQKRELERQLKQSMQQAWTEYETASVLLNNMQKRREINQGLFETNQAQFEGAQIRLLQLMQSENQYFQTKLEYINARYRQKLSEFGVLAALGQLQNAMEIMVDDAEFAKRTQFRFDDDE